MMHLVRPPWEDESLSSWLYRQSKLHGLSPQSYISLSLPGVEIWTRDVDRWLPDVAVRDIARRLGQTDSAIRSMTIAGLYGDIVGGVRGYNTVHWIMPIGVYHRRRRRHGQQFCPECYLESGVVKLPWRLAWSSICERHQCFLIDACEVCDAPITLFYTNPYRHHVCFNCGHDIAVFGTRDESYDLCAAFSRRFSCSYLASAPDPGSLRTLMTLQLGQSQGRHLHRAWCSRIGIESVVEVRGRWECIRAHERRVFIAATEAVLQTGLDRMVGDLVEHGVTRECLRNHHSGQSLWLEQYVYPKLVTKHWSRKSRANYKAETTDPLKKIQRKHRALSRRERGEARARFIDMMIRGKHQS